MINLNEKQHSISAERSVIGSLILDNDVYQLIASYLDIDYSNISKSGFLRQVFMPFPMIDKNQSVLY